MTSKSRQLIFGGLAILGAGVTWYFNIQFMQAQGGFSLSEFVAATNLNAAANSISSDLLIATLTFLFWSFLEARRLGMKGWWLYLVLTFGVAIAFAFPLFMLMRERSMFAGDAA